MGITPGAGRHFLVLYLWCTPAMGVDMGVSMTGGPLGVPVLVPGPVLGRKGSWSLNALFGLQDSHGIPVEE